MARPGRESGRSLRAPSRPRGESRGLGRALPARPGGARPRRPARGAGPERRDNAARGGGRAARWAGARAAFPPAASASRRRRRRRARGLAALPSAPPRPAPGRPPPPARTRPSPPESLGARGWVAGSSRRLCASASGLARQGRRRRSPRRGAAGGRTGRAEPSRAELRGTARAAPAPAAGPRGLPTRALRRLLRRRPAPRASLCPRAGRAARRRRRPSGRSEPARRLRRRLPRGRPPAPARRGDAGPDLRVGIRGRDP